MLTFAVVAAPVATALLWGERRRGLLLALVTLVQLPVAVIAFVPIANPLLHAILQWGRSGGATMTPEVRRALTAAGDERSIPAFCADLLSGQHGEVGPSATPAPHPQGTTPSRSHPGGGNGVGRSPDHGHPAHSPRH